jgi:hypothetical protein
MQAWPIHGQTSIHLHKSNTQSKQNAEKKFFIFLCNNYFLHNSKIILDLGASFLFNFSSTRDGALND